MVADLRYFNFLEHEVDSLKSQLETQKTQFLNEIDRLSRKYYYADHMNVILGVYTTLNEFTDIQCDYVDQVVKCERLEKELSKSNTTSKSFEALQKHAINLELALQQCKEQIKNDKAFKENQSNVFLKEREQYFEIQDLKAQLQDKGIAISELKKLIEKLKGKFVETKFEKPSVIRQPNAFKNQRQSVLGKPATFSDSLAKSDFSKSKTKMLMVVPISTREPKRTVNQSVATSLKRTVASESTNQKPRSKIRKQYEQISKTCKWWYSKITPPGYKWKPKTSTVNVKPNVSMPLGVKSRTTTILEPMTLRKSTISNTPSSSNSFAARTVKYGNDQIASILGYGDLVQGNITIKRVYYVEGLNHNLFSVGQFCDADLEVAFRKSTCYIRDLKGNDLLTGSRGTDLYSITFQDTSTPNPICLMAKATSSQAWLWHRRLSHLNFDSINLLSKNDIVIGLPKLKFVKDHLCSSYELWKAKRKSFHTKTTPSSKRRLQLLHMDLCGPMRVESINGKKYVLVIVDDYSRYTWTHFLRSKDKTPEVLIDFLRLAEAIATSCFTQNRSLVIPRHEKTPYHIINGRKPSVKFFHIFGSLCYIVRDGENIDKMKEKGDACIFVGYSTHSRAYRVYNKRTKVIVETIHVNFDELPQMASDHVSSDLVPQCPTTTLEHDSLSPGPQSQENVPQAAETVITSNELDLLFSPMFDE
ncbi:retrovirus-related pol polyprotein from transposon TNT 1-94 [Tanacetum coccineum]|uniref:Retrovirus-related pol polyprotein from transposon TNT 1-94 n=1 Tax=Tanacetum coccineum TaxID=301880 RepID=A0ABQ5DVH6_9ASTR